MELTNVTLAVLAGGAGSRMGQPKGLLRIHGRPILEYLREQIAWPGPVWLITAPGREHPPGCEKFHREITDPVAGMGPLRGILTTLENAATPLLAVVTVDMPGVGRAQLEWLARQLNHTESIGVMCRRLLAKESIVEPFPLMLRRAALDVVRARLQSGRLSVIGLLEEPGFSAANTPPEWGERVWVNLNRPVDLQHFSEKTDGGW